MTQTVARNWLGEYAALLVELARAQRQDAPEDELDPLYDRLDAAASYLGREEIAFTKGLSGDLYQLAEDENFSPAESSEWAVMMERLQAAVRERDWHQVLKLLRRRSATTPAAAVAWLRGTAYGELGHWEVALDFLEYALAREPDHPGLRYQVLHALARCGRAAEALRRGHDWPGASGADLPWLIEYAALAAAEDAGPERAFLRDAEARLREAAARGASAELFRTAA